MIEIKKKFLAMCLTKNYILTTTYERNKKNEPNQWIIMANTVYIK